MTEQPENSTPTNKKKSPLVWAMLGVPYLALCFPQIYARETPTLFGFPFFYWYQFVWVILTSVLLGIVYRRLKD